MVIPDTIELLHRHEIHGITENGAPGPISISGSLWRPMLLVGQLTFKEQNSVLRACGCAPCSRRGRR